MRKTLLFCALFLSSHFCIHAQLSYDDAMKQGKTEFDAGNFEGAAGGYKMALALKPKDEFARGLLKTSFEMQNAIKSIESGKYDQAKNILEKYAQTLPAAQYYLAQVYRETNKVKEARDLIVKAGTGGYSDATEERGAYEMLVEVQQANEIVETSQKEVESASRSLKSAKTAEIKAQAERAITVAKEKIATAEALAKSKKDAALQQISKSKERRLARIAERRKSWAEFDADNDGVPNGNDHCPYDAPGKAMNPNKPGCPIEKEGGFNVELLGGISAPFVSMKGSANGLLAAPSITGDTTIRNFFEDRNAPPFNVNMNLNWQAGLRLHYFAGHQLLNFMADIKFMDKTFKTVYDRDATPNTQKLDVARTYRNFAIEVPMYLKLHTKPYQNVWNDGGGVYTGARFMVFAGPLYSRHFQYKVTDSENKEIADGDSDKLINLNQFGVSGGIGLEFGGPKKGYFSLSAVYNRYFSDYYNRDYVKIDALGNRTKPFQDWSSEISSASIILTCRLW